MLSTPPRTPVTSWLDDAIPDVRRRDWRLAVTDAAGTRHLSLDELVAPGTTTVQATLDCTSGWYATRRGPAYRSHGCSRPSTPHHRSIRVRSLTGYDRYLPLSDLDHLLLAVAAGGAPLTPGHGYPARLVAPGRRGFWWVKWVAGVELSRRPWWAQPPFPLDLRSGDPGGTALRDTARCRRSTTRGSCGAASPPRPVARLATVRPDGSPRLVPVTFAVLRELDCASPSTRSSPSGTRGSPASTTSRGIRASTLLVDHYDDDWSALWWVRDRRDAAAHADR